MRLILVLSLIGLSLAAELNTFSDYLIFAAKTHYKSVSDYAKTIGITELDREWSDFKIKFSRDYSEEADEERKFYFFKSLQFIQSHQKRFNEGEVSHEVDVNEFADWTPEELNARLSSQSIPELNLTGAVVVNPAETFYAALPASFDWRTQGKVTPIKNQATCGSCWAFAAIATIESAFAIKHNQMVRLSEQELVDCNTANKGCQFGNVGLAMEYIRTNGIENENDYQYMNRKQNCMNNAAKPHTRIIRGNMLQHPSTDEQIMQAIITNGPLAVNIDASGNDFMLYKTGILTTGNKNMNHYVTAVGWGPNYWIVKNSWGTTWGQGGFAQLARGVNIRGFNNWLFFPTV